MDTIKSVVQRLLHKRKGTRHRWEPVPQWPPDLFAVVATLINLSGCYARSEYQCGLGKCAFDEAYRKRVRKLGRELGRNGIAPAEVQRAWANLLAAEAMLAEPHDEQIGWMTDAMFLLAVADEACIGVGFPLQTTS